MQNVNAIRRLIRRIRPMMFVPVAGAIAACASPPPPFPELPRLGVSTHIGSRHMCGFGISPPINISNAPATTARYRLRMTNTDVLFQTPWQTTVPAVANGYAEGAVADYQGPCVGELRLYAAYPYYYYRFEVLALDAQDRPLAYGQTTLIVQAINHALDQERAARGSTPPPVPPPTLSPALNPALQPRLPGPVYEP
jgi:phosphatidylethanolamine-binding protein (PEBP) family uncharacterized protein